MWCAQLYITIDVQDVKDPKTSLENVDGTGKLSFSGTAGAEQQPYAVDLVLMKEIDVQASKVSVSGRNVFIMLIKTEPGHWPRLTKESGRHLSHIKCDWNKWVDEDEEDEAADKFDFSQYNFSGFGEEGGDAAGGAEDEEEDSDNEELPDLVK